MADGERDICGWLVGRFMALYGYRSSALHSINEGTIGLKAAVRRTALTAQ